MALLNHGINRDLSMNRRSFIRKSAIVSMALFIPKFILSKPWYKLKRKIKILHTNDFHSRIESFDLNHAKYPGMGGISRIKTLIDRERNDETLLLDSGDIMQGTPYFNQFGGSMEIEWMNRAKFDASTLGNHDFDNGLESLASWIKQANFDFVNCNYETKNTPLEGLLKPYVIKQINQRKVGIIGVGINPEGLIPKKKCEGIGYLDPVSKANDWAEHLKTQEKVDMVILLSHLGFSYKSAKIDDCKLAVRSKHIDLILGGHTHTFMDKPFSTKNVNNKPVVIHQVGWAGLRLGNLDFKI